MAFFKKLKDRLFKSSSKIDEGLEAIVDDGGVEEIAVEQDPAQSEAEDNARLQAEQARAEADAAQIAEEAQAQADLAQAQADARAAAEAAQLAIKAQEEKDIELKAEQARVAAKMRLDAERARAEQEADAERKAAQLAVAEAEAARAAQETARQQAEAKADLEKREAAHRSEIAAQEAAERAAAERAANEKVQAEHAAAQAAQDAAERVAAEAAQAAEAATKPGLIGRILGRKPAKTVVRRILDDDMLEQLEELLISTDMGVDTALRVTANMAEGRMGKKLSVDEIKTLLSNEIARIMEPVARPLPLYPNTPQVVLVVGVNGSGKTTTIGKLASQFRAAGKQVVIAAGDTFRAAAVEQLQVWGERAGVPVLTAPEGSDPASLAYDAMTKAQEDGADLLLIDTAGRLQNRSDLMEELAKIVRVIRKKDETAPHNTLLVLDATTGQNAINQVKIFQEVSDVSGLVMTKLDGTAKGGVLVALADKFGLPIHAIGVGEQIDDLDAFDPEDFAKALTGAE
ncbi:signal recognition particle-docking protein FtsY [Pseudosulfitobacter sp. SM2401]|uniref:signal recognition particle-docking protein FtsY n=1 Tax=Pseudosulfitobacter sp. SM2401 TaxID=3350098 RepID=UPI0036F1B1A8